MNKSLIFRSSRPEVFCEKGVLRNFAKFTGKHLCQSPFFNKVAGLKARIHCEMFLSRHFMKYVFHDNFIV